MVNMMINGERNEKWSAMVIKKINKCGGMLINAENRPKERMAVNKSERLRVDAKNQVERKQREPSQTAANSRDSR